MFDILCRGGGSVTISSMNKKPHGFTIVELLIVIVIIAILAAITIVSYNGIQQRAAASKRESDAKQLLNAIHMARINTGGTLLQVTGSTYSLGSCTTAANNPGLVEPKDLPKTHVCWTRYYANLTNVGNAAGVNLESLREGDRNGNPYMWDENEGEGGNFCATDGGVRYFTGSGVSNAEIRAIPKTVTC